MIYGCFFFKKLESGNLVGEYSNQESVRRLPESAVKIIEHKDDTINASFIGKYQTTWFETDTETNSSELIIEYKQNTNNQLFSLKWKAGKSLLYTGEGFIVDGILIGNYSDKK